MVISLLHNLSIMNIIKIPKKYICKGNGGKLIRVNNTRWV